MMPAFNLTKDLYVESKIDRPLVSRVTGKWLFEVEQVLALTKRKKNQTFYILVHLIYGFRLVKSLARKSLSVKVRVGAHLTVQYL